MNYLSPGAGFLPSTVWLDVVQQQGHTGGFTYSVTDILLSWYFIKSGILLNFKSEEADMKHVCC